MATAVPCRPPATWPPFASSSNRVIRPNRPHALRLLVAWAVLSVIGVVIGLQLSLPPGSQSQQSVDQSWLLKLMTLISTPLFIGVVLYILYSVFAFRQRRGVLEDGR